MTITLYTVLLLLAVICFFLAFVGIPSGRYNLIALGLFLITLERLLTR